MNACVHYVGKELNCNGEYHTTSGSVFVENGRNIIASAKNPSDADAYVWDENGTLHIFKSCCHDKMICTYNSGHVKLFNDSTGIWSKEIDCRDKDTGNPAISGQAQLTVLVDYNDGYRVRDNYNPQYCNIAIDDAICKFDFVNEKYESVGYLSRTGEGRFQNSDVKTCILLCSMNDVSDKTFKDCTSLVEYGNYEFMSKIGRNAFDGCTSLPKIVIGSHVNKIEPSAFSNCSSASTLEFISGNVDSNNPYDSDSNSGGCSNLSSLSNNTFNGCSSLRYTRINGIDIDGIDIDGIVIPSNIKEIGSSCFSNCTSIINLYLNKQNQTVDSESNNINGGLGSASFYHCRSLTGISGFSCINYIKFQTFMSCTSLTKIDDSTNVLEIGEQAFEWDTNLKTINLPQCHFVGRQAFANSGIEEIDLPSLEDFKVMKNNMIDRGGRTNNKREYCALDFLSFYNADSLTAVTLPNSSSQQFTIGKYAFSDCDSLKTVNNLQYAYEIQSDAFEDCSSLESIHLNLEFYENNAFAGCTGLKSITLGDSTNNKIADGFNMKFENFGSSDQNHQNEYVVTILKSDGMLTELQHMFVADNKYIKFVVPSTLLSNYTTKYGSITSWAFTS